MSENKEITGQITEQNTFLSSEFTGCTREALWNEFLIKIKRPDLYLPVSQLETKDLGNGLVWRDMTVNFQGVVRRIVEEIDNDESQGIVRFYVLDEQGNRTNHVHYNHLHQNGENFSIEYYSLDTSTGLKTPLQAIKAFQIKAANAINNSQNKI